MGKRATKYVTKFLVTNIESEELLNLNLLTYDIVA